MTNTIGDSLIIGAGPAGLSAATYLGSEPFSQHPANMERRFIDWIGH
jgi:cation diffusion facilitator CzcD-associated flavoprotein CzcO